MDIVLEWASRLPWHHPLRLSTLKLALCTKESMEKYANELEDIREYARHRARLPNWFRTALADHDRYAVTLAIHSGLAESVIDGGECQTLLHLACRMSHPDLVAILLDKGADVNTPTGWSTITPLYQSIMASTTNGLDPTAAVLLARGADPNPALYPAMILSNTETVDALIDAGAAITDATGVSALTASIAHNKLEMVRCLVNRGAEITKTLLYYTIEYGREEIMGVFLAAGADVDHTVLDFARHKGHHGIVALLETYMVPMM